MKRLDPYDDEHPIGESLKILKDRNSCTVVALACVTGNTYQSCHNFLSKYGGRKKGKGMLPSEVIKAFTHFKHFKVKKGLYTRQNRITINQFIQKHPKGKFYCCNRNHAFAIIDGVLYDHSDKARRQITLAYRFYSKEDLEELYG